MESFRSDYGEFWGTVWAVVCALYILVVVILAVYIVVALIKVIAAAPQSIFFGKKNRRQINKMRDLLRTRYLNGQEKDQALVCHFAMYDTTLPFILPWICATNKRTKRISRCFEYAREDAFVEDWREMKSRDRLWADDGKIDVVDFFIAKNGMTAWCAVPIFVRWGLRISKQDDLNARKRAKDEYEKSQNAQTDST